MQAIGGQALPVLGTDYPTPDGTAIRDYIHVKDLAQAHVQALCYLQKTEQNQVINLGTGTGASVLDIVNTIEKVTLCKVPLAIFPRREGDAPEAVANASKAREVLNFTPQYSDLTTIIESEWASFSKQNPSN